MRKILSLAILGFAAAAASASERAPGETVIPFANSMSNIEWEAVSDDSLYLRGARGEWYFVRTANRCTRLLQARGIGFRTSALGQLDRHSAILVQGVPCPVASIVASDGPPEKPRRKAG